MKAVWLDRKKLASLCRISNNSSKEVFSLILFVSLQSSSF